MLKEMPQYVTLIIIYLKKSWCCWKFKRPHSMSAAHPLHIPFNRNNVFLLLINSCVSQHLWTVPLFAGQNQQGTILTFRWKTTLYIQSFYIRNKTPESKQKRRKPILNTDKRHDMSLWLLSIKYLNLPQSLPQNHPPVMVGDQECA